MKKSEIIQETIAYYSVPGRRSLNPVPISEDSVGPRCLYMGPDGKRCAFARVVANPKVLVEGDCASACISTVNVKFLPGYEGHGGAFWDDVQALHDNNESWAGEGGLTPYGEAQATRLLSKWAALDDPSVN